MGDAKDPPKPARKQRLMKCFPNKIKPRDRTRWLFSRTPPPPPPPKKMQRHPKTAEVGRRRKERRARGSFICARVYLSGDVQDELESQNTLLLAENTVFTALFFIALGGFLRPSTRSAIILSFVFHFPPSRSLRSRRAFQVWQVPFASLLLFLLPFQAGAAGQLWVPASQSARDIWDASDP